MTVDGRRSRFRIADLLDVTMTPLINPVSGEASEVDVVYPKGGFIWNHGEVTTTSTMRINRGTNRNSWPICRTNCAPP